MTEYLKDRNSRWGTEENKLALVTFSLILSFLPSKVLGPIGCKRQKSRFHYSIKKYVLLKFNTKSSYNNQWSKWIQKLKKFKVRFLLNLSENMGHK